MKYICVDLTGRIGEDKQKCFAFLSKSDFMFKGFDFEELWFDIPSFKSSFSKSNNSSGDTLNSFLELIPESFFDGKVERDVNNEVV